MEGSVSFELFSCRGNAVAVVVGVVDAVMSFGVANAELAVHLTAIEIAANFPVTGSNVPRNPDRFQLLDKLTAVLPRLLPRKGSIMLY